MLLGVAKSLCAKRTLSAFIDAQSYTVYFLPDSLRCITNFFIIANQCLLAAASSTAERILMKLSVTNVLIALGLVTIGVALAAVGIYIGETDDAPGAALIGILLMIGAVVLGVRTARRKT